MTQSQSQTTTQTTTISADTQLSGTLNFDGNAIVLGTVNGKIAGKGTVTIGQHAVCNASFDVTSLTIDGTVEGNITAKESVQLSATARVTGDISAQSITIAPGASFAGNLRINSDTTSTLIESKTQVRSQPTPSPQSLQSSETSPSDLEPTSATASTWATAKPASLGAGLTGLGTSRAAWPNQR